MLFWGFSIFGVIPLCVMIEYYASQGSGLLKRSISYYPKAAGGPSLTKGHSLTQKPSHPGSSLYQHFTIKKKGSERDEKQGEKKRSNTRHCKLL